MEKYASLNNIPIIEKDSIEFIEKYIKDNNVKNILELGTAIAYSTIRMALVSDDIHITTIERVLEKEGFPNGIYVDDRIPKDGYISGGH